MDPNGTGSLPVYVHNHCQLIFSDLKKKLILAIVLSPVFQKGSNISEKVNISDLLNSLNLKPSKNSLNLKPSNKSVLKVRNTTCIAWPTGSKSVLQHKP